MARKAKILPPEAVREIVQAMDGGKETRRAMMTKYMSDPWNLSKDKIYSVARENGWDSGRKVRSDKGQIRLLGVDEAQIEMVAKVMYAGTRPKSGKRLIPTVTVQEQLGLNGHSAIAKASCSTVNRLLRQRGFNHAQLMAGNAAVQMRSRYPNHIHFVDASVCVQWDMKGGKKLVPRDMQKAFYKNKPQYWKSVRQVLIRWLVVDHCSGAFYVDYTYASGENQIDLLGVLLDAWGEKPSIADRYPFHGAPDMLGMDAGAANTSHEVQALLKKLGIKDYVHSPGNARASGCVETMHAFWERNFEWGLLIEAADNLEELRNRAHDCMIYLNASREHSRHGKTRTLKWMEIQEDQLHLLPPKAQCKALATSQPVTRVPDECLRISFNNIKYQLAAPALKGRQVLVDHHPWQAGNLNVMTAAGEAVPCKAIVTDSHGYDEHASVFGEEQYRSHSDTPAQRLRKEFESADKATRLGGFRPKPMAGLAPDLHYMPRKGQEIVLADLPKVPPVKASEVPRKIRQALRIETIPREVIEALNEKLQGLDVVTPDQVDELIAWARTAWAEHLPGARPGLFNASQINA